jgi:hypothetical protein
MMFSKSLVTGLCLIVACGCEKRREPQARVTAQDDSEYVIAVLVDLSGSFLDKMTEGGQAHDFMLALIDRYFRDRIGTNDQIILAQISGTPDRALLWQGTPLELRKDFPNARAFSDFLRSKADPLGSHVHNAMTQTVEYVMSQPNVSTKKAKSAVFAMTDMLDNGPEPHASRAQAVNVLRDYGQIGGMVCLYYVDQTLIPVWQRELQKTGLAFSIDSKIRRPKLPSFE